MIKNLTALAILAVLAGCGPPPVPSVFVRTDGRSIKDHPELQPEFEVARTACNGEMNKAALSGVTFAGGGIAGAIAQGQRNEAAGEVGKGCMAEKGYMLVPTDQAEERAREFARAAAVKAASEKPKPRR